MAMYALILTNKRFRKQVFSFLLLKETLGFSVKALYGLGPVDPSARCPLSLIMVGRGCVKPYKLLGAFGEMNVKSKSGTEMNGIRVSFGPLDV